MVRYIYSILVGLMAISYGFAQNTNSFHTIEPIEEGLSRSIPYSRVIKPFDIEVSYDKTVHLIFPSIIRYVDLGSLNIIADKANSVENVLRVKANEENFTGTTSLSVITDDGAYYSFNVVYSPVPKMLSIEMGDILEQGTGVTTPDNRTDLFFGELAGEAPAVVKMIMRAVYENNRREYNNYAVREQKVVFGLRGLYSYNGLMYFHIYLRNDSNVSYNIDRVVFRIIDAKGANATAMQEETVQPLRTYNFANTVGGKKQARTVYCLESIAIPQDKLLEVSCYELNGGRTLSFFLPSKVLGNAFSIDQLKMRGPDRK